MSHDEPHTTETIEPPAGAGLVVGAMWAAVGLAAHVGFRPDTPEWVEIPTVLAVWFLVLCTWAIADAGWLSAPRWFRACVEVVSHTLADYRIQTGIDFGGSPEYERRLPPALLRLTGLLVVAITVGVLWRDGFPGPARARLIEGSGALYVGYVSILWGWSLFVGVAACAVVGVHVNDVIVNRLSVRSARTRAQFALVVGLVAAPAVAASVFPGWVPAAAVLVGALAGVLVLLMGKRGQIRFLWREKGKPEIYSVGSAWLLGWGDLSLAGVVALSIVPTTGRLWSGLESGAPITAGIGLLTAWAGVFALWTWLWVGPLRMLRLARRDPAVAMPPGVEFVGETPGPDVLEALEARGFRLVRDGTGRHRLRLRLDTSEARRTLRGEEGSDGVEWRVHPRDVLHPQVLAEMRAADRHMRRRELVEGIGRLLASATARTFKSGTGFWFAPHLWYVPAMSRDTDEDASMTVGPPYARVLSPEARRHAYEVFQAVHVDLIFIEDGVPTEGVERVLLQVFDHFDLWGVDPIEEKHIFSVPGVRVLLHQFEFDAPLAEEGYPEPDYENLARGRVLHIMKDRGGEEVDDPFELLPDHRPSLVPVGALS